MRKFEKFYNVVLRRHRGMIATSVSDSSWASVVLLALNENGADESTSFDDASDVNATITAYGDAAWEADSAPTGLTTSAYFDGAGSPVDRLDVAATASISGTGDFTVDLWINPTSFGASYRVIYANKTNNGLAILVNSTGTISFGRSGVAIDGTTSNTVTFGAWNHIAVARSSGTLKIFIGGEQGYSAANTTDYQAGVIVLGVDGNTTSFPYVGYIAAVRNTLGVARWTANFTPPSLPLPTS